MVGDSLELDVLGAENAGMRALWYAGPEKLSVHPGFSHYSQLEDRITQKDKINIARARKEWNKLTATEKKLALENIEEYYAHQKDIRFCKQAATYLADKAFLNEYEF